MSNQNNRYRDLNSRNDFFFLIKVIIPLLLLLYFYINYY